MKHTYSASFGDGSTITRTTDRTYTHAWKCGRIEGFSGTLALAEAQVKSYKRSRPADTVCEIVQVSIMPAEVVNNFKTDNPWKIQRFFKDGRKSWMKAGANRIARYATKAEAQALADEFNKSESASYYGTSYKAARD